MKYQGHIMEVNRDLKSGFGVVDLTPDYTHKFDFQEHHLHNSYQQPMPGDRVEFECHFQLKSEGRGVTGFIFTGLIALICRATPTLLANST